MEHENVYATHISTTVKLGKRPRPTKDTIISFFEEDMAHITTLNDDALIISTEIGEFDTKRIMVDRGRSTNILFLGTFESISVAKKSSRRFISP